MAFIVEDRVKETTTTTGAGTVTLAGAVSGFRAFSAVCANADTVPYEIDGGSEWEVGIGTWATGGTLARTTVISSSNSNAAVNFSTGTKNVALTWLSRYARQASFSPIAPPLAGSNVADDEWTESALDTGGTRFSSATAWAWNNQGSATATIGNGRCILKDPANGSTSIRMIEQALPAGTWAYVVPFLGLQGVYTNFMAAGLALRESGSSKYEILETAVSGGPNLFVNRFTDSSTFSATAYSTGFYYGPIFYKIEYDGTNLIYSLSFDGSTGSFAPIESHAKAAFFSTAPDKIGLTCWSNGSSKDTYAVFGPFRRVA